jgi:hypothetical protein
MKFAVEIGLGSMMDVPVFTKITSGIQKVIVNDSHTRRQHEDRMSLI